MLFNFILMQSIYLGMARQDARPIAKALRDTVRKTDDQQYANFLRNHDELTLDKLTDAQRQEVFDAFGPEEDMQLFDAACAAGCLDARRGRDGSGWRTACSSRFPGRRCCSTARRSGWARTSRSTVG